MSGGYFVRDFAESLPAKPSGEEPSLFLYIGGGGVKLTAACHPQPSRAFRGSDLSSCRLPLASGQS